MMVDKRTLAKFKAIYKDEFGEELGDEEALKKFMRLVNVLKIIRHPDKQS